MDTRVYKNLNTGLWSLKQKVDGKWVVVGHAASVTLNKVTPYVSDARHEHVRSGNYREVFAWLVGELVDVDGVVPYKGREPRTADAFAHRPRNRCLDRVTFHPFAEVKRGFFYADTGVEFEYAPTCHFTAAGEVYAS